VGRSDQEPRDRPTDHQGPEGDGAPVADVIREVVSLVEAGATYLADLFRLERFRLENEVRGGIRRLIFVLGGGAVALLGLFLVSLGLAAWISARTGSPPAGLLLVGAGYLFIGLVVAMIAAARRHRQPGRGRDSTSRSRD
jgi:hypothetical protein